MFRIGKLRETERKLVVARGWRGWEEMGSDFNGYEVSF